MRSQSRSRVLTREELKELLLSLIAGERRHGYELIRKIKSLSKGAYAPSPGMVYPALAELEEAGLASHEEDENARKVFTASDAGRERSKTKSADVEALVARLTDLGNQPERDPALERALANLEMVLLQSTAEATAERIDQIIDLVDDASRKIERLDR